MFNINDLFIRLFEVDILLQTVVSQFACGTVSTAVGRDAVVTGDGLRLNDVEDAEVVGEFPDVHLVELHEWRVYVELVVHCQVYGLIGRLYEVGTAVGVSAEVGLRDACDYVVDVFCEGNGGGES